MNARVKAVFYRQLSVMLGSGIHLGQALEHISATGATGGIRQAAGEIGRRLRDGDRFSEAMARAFGPHLSRFELAAIAAGEKSGMLPEGFRGLADYFEAIHLFRARIISGMVYPGLVLHAAIVIPAVPALILRGPAAFLARVLPPFAFVYGFAAALFFFRQAVTRTRLARAWDALLLDIPVVGHLVRAADLSKVLQALASLYKAGVPIAEALDLAAETAGNAVIRAHLSAVAPSLRRGMSLGEALKDCPVLPPVVYNFLVTGEASGRLDETLERCAGYLQQEVQTASERFLAVLPTLAFLLAAAYAAAVIISFWQGYASQIGDLLGD